MPSSAPSGTLVPSTLKVAELRKALSSRGYPTKGLKKELIERLEEALAKEQSGAADQAPTPSVTSTGSASPSQPSPSTVPESAPASQPEPDAAQAFAPEAVLVALATQACSTSHTVTAPVETWQPNQTLGSAVVSAHGPTSTPPNDQSPITKSPRAGDQTDIPEPEALQASAVHTQAAALASKPPPVSNSTKAEPVLTEMSQSLDVGQQEAVADSIRKNLTATPSPKLAQPVVKSNHDRKRPASPLEKSESSPKRLCSREESPVTSLPTERRDSAKTAPEAAPIIYIRHLTRPLNNEKLRALLATYGTVKRLVLNTIKTYAFVEFAFPEEATNAIRSLQGIVFPETTGRAIDLGSISETRMSQLIREEAQVLAQGLRKVEILDAPSDAPLEWGGIMLGDASDLAKSTAAAWERHDGRQAPQMDGDAAAAAKLPVIALEDLFCQTKTTPVLYYKPVFVPSTPSPKAL